MKIPTTWTAIAAFSFLGATLTPSLASANDRPSYTLSNGVGQRTTHKAGTQSSSAAPDDHTSLVGNAADYSTSGRVVRRDHLPSNARGGGPVSPSTRTPARVNK